MKNLLLLFIIGLLSTTLKAQNSPCTPDASLQDSLFGLWPDTIQNLPLANVDQYYEEHIQIKIPGTVGEVMGSPFYLPGTIIDISALGIDSLKLISIEGLPDVINSYISNSDSIFEGNTVACLTLFGTPGVNQIGQHDITIFLNGWVTAPFIGVTSLYDELGSYETINGYKFIVQQSMSIIENQESSFVVSQNFPNPLSDLTQFEIQCKESKGYEFKVLNLLGECIFQDQLHLKSGHNTYHWNASQITSGIYFYSLSDGQKVTTKKMIVKH